MTTPPTPPSAQPPQSGPFPNQPPQFGPTPGQPYPPIQPTAAPKKNKKKWPWIVGALVVLGIIIGAVSGGEEASTGSSSSTGSGSADTNSGSDGTGGSDTGGDAGLNAPVRDGKFEFVVTGVESGLSTVGTNEFLAQKAQGQFVVVTMTVQNTSDKPQSFSPSNQKLKDAAGRTFETDSSAQIALDDTDIAVWDNINPGNTVTVKLVFDMPADAQPASLELHDSAFSGGATVNLR
ncbi:hypothetical protein GOHSU_22_00910 [Gordonia hirsuta DSM 44140 = NBRC 16056]|uniref:DUF4352 domain-containing protein n=1 Tax=Gordonia hirsuta DSM 44140 = NBRC 16056 TaxID=1121927 RepID=L7LA56_9ACTN|nr:DUF4352 domain-containing protein [Gordonia hirsuta]GAC57631.1 hypothetical protein GOHSU_22_00910 [Gordonia hirsuta DSM 44140 = NBRC 16056]